MTKRIITILVLVLSLSLFASAAEISSADDMLTLMNTPSMWADSYTLTTDIDLGDATNGLSQTPIGTEATPFTGSFDGAGYEISGINLVGETCVALFGYTNGGTIENLTISGTVSSSGEYTGGFVAYAKDEVYISRCHNKCDLIGLKYMGGICAYATGSDKSDTVPKMNITECMNSGDIICLDTVQSDTGGIAGSIYAVGNISDCFNEGLISTGDVSLSKPFIGGIVGKTGSYGRVANCYNITAPQTPSTETTYVRAIVGRPNVKNGSNNFFKDGLGMSDKNYGSAYTTADFAALNEHGLWVNATEPRLAYFATEISSADDMLTLMNTPSMWADNYKLTTDIDLGDATNGLSQAPIGTETNPFTGNFDGQGYTVSGIAIDGSALGMTDNVGLFGYIGGGGTVMIKNLTVSGTVSGSGENIGGIIGYIYTTNITIQNCTNLCTVSSSSDFTGGIFGRLDSSSENALISECKNMGAISGNSYAGGIAGFSSSTKGSITVEKCLNTGFVTTVGGASAGIVGYWRDQGASSGACSVRDCMNTGAIVAGTSGYAAGIIAHGAGKDVAYTVTRCFNTGKITATKASYVRPIVGRPSASTVSAGGISDCYYTSTDTYTTAATEGEIYVSDATVAASVSGLGDAFVLVDGYTPELKVFHTHDYKYLSTSVQQHNYACYCGKVALTEEHNFIDGVCDKCGASSYCPHENGEWREISVANCFTLAKYTWYCFDCRMLIEDMTKEGDAFASGIHVSENYEWNFDGEKYYYTCTACESKVEQTEAPTVYVSANGDDANNGRTAESAVATLNEAVSRIANVGGTVMVCGTYPLEDTTLPTYTKPITIRGYDNGLERGGFKISSKTLLSLGGETVLDNLCFDGGHTYVIACNWNNVTFGAIEAKGNAITYLLLGKYNIKTSDDTPAEATLTITENAWVSDHASDTETATRFYSRIYLGDSFGADGISASNKTATLNATNVDIGTLYTMSTTANYANCPTENCETTVNLYGRTRIDQGRTGDKNVSASDSTASLTNLTLNFFDNSIIGTNFYIRNVENTVLYVSGSTDGRTVPMDIGFAFYSYGSFATDETNMNVDFSYGTHSFAPALSEPLSYNAEATAQKIVTVNKKDECVYTSKVTVEATPDANGTKLYSCTCGRSYTEEYAYSCEEKAHFYVANADGTYTCKVCDKNFTAVSGDNVFAISSAVVANGTVTVTATVKGNFAAALVDVVLPSGFTFAEAMLPTVNGFVCSGNANESVYSISILSDNAASKTLDMEIKLVYSYESGIVASGQLVEILVPELYNGAMEKEVATTVCALTGRIDCAHSVIEEVITLAPTCSDTGLKKVVCEECKTVIEMDAVVEKDSTNHSDYACVSSINGIICSGCKAAVDAPTAPVIIMATPKLVANGKVEVVVSVKATAPIFATRFAIDAPEGFALLSAEALLGDETTYSLIGQDSISLPFEAVVMNMTFEDNAVDFDVLKLTFSADGIQKGNYPVSVSAVETYNCKQESVDTLAISAEVNVEDGAVVGDIDGDRLVTVLDALMLIRTIVNDETVKNGDVNGDGKVGLTDVIRIMKLIAQ